LKGVIILICKNCNGTGSIIVQEIDIKTKTLIIKAKQCNKCNGTGKQYIKGGLL